MQNYADTARNYALAGALMGSVGGAVAPHVGEKYYTGIVRGHSPVRPDVTLGFLGAAAGGVLGGMFGLIEGATTSYAINGALSRAGANLLFKDLTANQAALLVGALRAAEQEKPEWLKAAAQLPGTAGFIAQPGILQSLADLYFDDTSPEKTTELEALIASYTLGV